MQKDPRTPAWTLHYLCLSFHDRSVMPHCRVPPPLSSAPHPTLCIPSMAVLFRDSLSLDLCRTPRLSRLLHPTLLIP